MSQSRCHNNVNERLNTHTVTFLAPYCIAANKQRPVCERDDSLQAGEKISASLLLSDATSRRASRDEHDSVRMRM